MSCWRNHEAVGQPSFTSGLDGNAARDPLQKALQRSTGLGAQVHVVENATMLEENEVAYGAEALDAVPVAVAR